MVFKEEYGEHWDDLMWLDNYNPYRKHGEKNPSFNAYSGFLLDLKENQTGAVERFRRAVETYIATDIAIAVVPSHDPAKTTSGLRSLAVALAANDRIDATSCLVRSKKIDKLAHGGDRSIEVHLGSIIVRNAELIKGQDVLLLDDVATSGNSLEACRQLLLKAGAARVQKLALGKTV
ncbi:MAG: phosphoribosyltransferase [Planctomycetes bacterium]|nr:phosphoribosyltransferase [Planctomycetota bacterium]